MRVTVLWAVIALLLAGCEARQSNNVNQSPGEVVDTKVIDEDGSDAQAQIRSPNPVQDSVESEPSAAPQSNQELRIRTLAERQLAGEVRTSAKLATGLTRAEADLAYHSQVYPHQPPHPPHWYPAPNRENYESFDNNPLKWVRNEPVSTFSVDVDTASYANVRRMLNQGQLPPADAVRVEELINYFSYQYPRAEDRSQPFSIYTEMGPSPWHASNKLLHVGINGWQPDQDALPPANLVFLIDVSGSMNSPNKLGLLKSAMKLMVNELRPEDKVSIAVYAGSSGTVLEPTQGNQKAKINAAIERLHAGGSTNGAAGIHLAYQMAEQHFNEEGVNRVILATDGDFNVGTTDIDDLEKLVERKRKSGVALTVLGFGQGNYNDHLMQKIAQIGNGNAAYIDTMSEARKVLVEELGATLNIIAKDMKVQIEFNPKVVSAYRLIGYETRHLNREDFNNDRIDAGEVGAGHTVTALYELTFVDADNSMVDGLRYAPKVQSHNHVSAEDEVAFLRLRYKQPNGQRSALVEHPLYTKHIRTQLADTSDAYRFSAAVAWLGQQLRGNKQVHDDLQEIVQLAQQAKGRDAHGYRAEFINLAKIVAALT